MTSSRYFYRRSSDYAPRWRALSKAFSFYSPIDRTKTFDSFGFEYSVYTPIPHLDYCQSMTTAETADHRAQELAKYGKLAVLWSGGIDSTLVVAALIKACVPFTVLYTDWSTQEYPLLFARMRRGEWTNIRLRQIGNTPFPQLQDEYFVITGMCGDQCIGSENVYNMKDSGIKPNLLEPWRDLFHSSFVDFFEPQVEKAQVPINNFADFLWWISFSMKFQNVQLNIGTIMGTDMSRMYTFAHFFESAEWQCWAMRNRHVNNEFIRRGIEQDYKKEYKQYIHEVLDDRDYLINKPKVRSVSDDLRNRRPMNLLDVGGQIVPEYLDV